MTVNRDTYVHDMLWTCGGDNVFAASPARYPTVTLEDVRAAAPDVILLPDEPYRFRAAHRADFAQLADVPAVRAGRIHLVDGKLLSWYGPRIAEALDRLPALLSVGRRGRGLTGTRPARPPSARLEEELDLHGHASRQTLGWPEPHGWRSPGASVGRQQREAAPPGAPGRDPSGVGVETKAVRTTQRRRSSGPTAARAEARAFAVARRRAAPASVDRHRLDPRDPGRRAGRPARGRVRRRRAATPERTAGTYWSVGGVGAIPASGSRRSRPRRGPAGRRGLA